MMKCIELTSMSEFTPVQTLEEFDHLDENEILAGYWAGIANAAEPGNDRSRAYWHGWRNGMVDGKHAQADAAQTALAQLMCHYITVKG